MDQLSPSLTISPAKGVAVNFVASLRDSLFDRGNTARKVTFENLFGILVLHLGRVLYQIVITISGFFPIIVVFAHIVEFALERCIDILEVEDFISRFTKMFISIFEVAALLIYCYFLINHIYAPGMVCALDESSTVCCVRDAAECGKSIILFHVSASWKVSDLFQEVGRKMELSPDSFELVLISDKNGKTVLDNKSDTIEMAGLKLETKNDLLVYVKADDRSSKRDEEESSSYPVSGDYTALPPPPPPPLPASTSSSGDYNHSGSIIRQEIGYVGLVNQAMTCYLNSLLQALFMTPEFRNALYNWEFDGSQNDESKSIPYQLQKLFLNLQTSHKSAVETTELTRSFGWDSSEAWQQHDIQELCRVMFDALEQKFKNTEQSDLINRLYEGKMIDYVKCLECSTEKFREDTFLDIPLPLRPFLSNIAYGSVEEALRAFVQPETLEGNNQYHCETCNKKCDAHKGLKFSKFPYLLTLHLKRFDFDYSTLHRIKLNDKVTFPEKLNLNSFIVNSAKGEEIVSESSPEETVVKCDDSSTTDSGSALDDEGCQGIDNVSMSNSHENHTADYQEDDEGIDVCQSNENEKNKQNAMESGPYIYELFSIMIHSGSAAGGHYYAYIKDFKDGEWYCFNDQSVTKITYEDIRKTYGGGPHRGYYSGVYSSSTNAYMLMYRQIDPERNSSAMTIEEFPPHIKTLHKKLEEQKEMEFKMRESDLNLFKVKLYCFHPERNILVERRVIFEDRLKLRDGVQVAHMAFNLENIVPLENCRLVRYDKAKYNIECSFEGREDELLCEVFQNHKSEYLLEIRKDGEEFEVYKPGNILTKVHLVNLETEEVTGPVMIRGNVYDTVREYKELVAKHLKLPVETLHIFLQNLNTEPKLLSCDDSQLKKEDLFAIAKIYAVSLPDKEDIKKPQILSKLREIIDIFGLVITLHIALPDVDSEILEQLNIPPLEQSQSTSTSTSSTLNIRQPDELLVSAHSRGASPNERDSSPQPLPDPEDECMGPAEPHSDQSASEDSSLTDSERTIVGEAPGDCLAQLSPSNSSVGSDQNVSSPENEGNDQDMKPGELRRNVRMKFKNCISNFRSNEMGESWDADDQDSNDALSRGLHCYFKASPYTDSNTDQKMLKVLVNKRMSRRQLKQCLEPYVGVSADHFKLCRSVFGDLEDESCRPTEGLSMYRDDIKLWAKLGRVLKAGEYTGDVYLLQPNSSQQCKFLCEWVIANGASVGQVKKELIEEVKKKRISVELEYNRCRLRRKNGKNPNQPYLDDSTFDDLTIHWEMFLQVLTGDEPVTNANQTLLFVRQWCPSTLELKQFQEIVLDTNLVSECKEKISQLSGIPVEFIDIAKAQGSFPCIDVSVLGIHSDLDWKVTASHLDKWPLNIMGDGEVIFYRDNRERVKHLSTDEKKEILSLENRGKLGSSCVFSYSPRKERALKIYLDTTPPRRREEADVDW